MTKLYSGQGNLDAADNDDDATIANKSNPYMSPFQTTQKLNVYVKCLDTNKDSQVHFVDCISVLGGKAETMVSEIVKLLDRKRHSFQ